MKRLIANAENPTGIEVDMSAEEETEADARLKTWEDGTFDRAILDLRNKRNRLLAETDFYALEDVTMSEDMTTYRQDLRNLPDGLTTVEKVEAAVYPTKPL